MRISVDILFFTFSFIIQCIVVGYVSFSLIYYYHDYFIDKDHSNTFYPATCQINRTLIAEIPCPTKLEVNKLCKKTLYAIVISNNSIEYYDQLPNWLSPIDLANLEKSPMNFSGQIFLTPFNLPCYHRTGHGLIRWERPDPQGYIQIILFCIFALFLIALCWINVLCYPDRLFNIEVN